MGIDALVLSLDEAVGGFFGTTIEQMASGRACSIDAPDLDRALAAFQRDASPDNRRAVSAKAAVARLRSLHLDIARLPSGGWKAWLRRLAGDDDPFFQFSPNDLLALQARVERWDASALARRIVRATLGEWDALLVPSELDWGYLVGGVFVLSSAPLDAFSRWASREPLTEGEAYMLELLGEALALAREKQRVVFVSV